MTTDGGSRAETSEGGCERACGSIRCETYGCQEVAPVSAGTSEGRLTDEELAEIGARADAATPGPWAFYNDDLWHGVTAAELAHADGIYAGGVPFSDEAEEVYERSGHLFAGDCEKPSDAAFIAHARSDIPRLLAAVRGQGEALRELREWIVTFDCDCFGGNAYQDAERCDRCTMLALIDEVCGPAPDCAECGAGAATKNCTRGCSPLDGPVR